MFLPTTSWVCLHGTSFQDDEREKVLIRKLKLTAKYLPQTMKLNVEILLQNPSGAKNKFRKAFAAVLGDLLKDVIHSGHQVKPSLIINVGCRAKNLNHLEEKWSQSLTNNSFL